jgi:hypothetical protein
VTTTMPETLLATCVFDKDPAYSFGCRRKKVTSTLPIVCLVPD